MKTIYLMLLLIPVVSSAQDQTIKDFNNDGVNDTLELQYWGGSGYGGYFLNLINGKTSEKFSLDTYGCFCDMKRAIPIPPILMQPVNKAFLEAIRDNLLPPRREDNDASLEWLLKAYISSKWLNESELTLLSDFVCPDGFNFSQ